MKSIVKLALVGVSAIAFAAPGYAQGVEPSRSAADNDQDGVANVNEIIVEARRRAETAQDVPAVINTVTQEDLQKLNIREGQDISSIVPGLQLSTNASSIGGNASLRGVNFDTFVSGNNPTVEFYQNDTPVPAQFFLQANYDIAQINTLRGPQGTLQGRASPSGAIKITTRRPDLYDFGGYIDATGNDIGSINLNGAVGIPIMQGVLGVRLAALYAEDEVNRVTTITDNGSLTDRRDPFARTKSGRISLLFQPSDWFEAFGSYQRIEREARYYQQVACNPFGPAITGDPCSPGIRGEDRRAVGDAPFDTYTTFDNYNATAKLSVSGQNLIYTGSYLKQTLDSFDPQDEGNLLPADFNPFAPGNDLATGVFPYVAVPPGTPGEFFQRSITSGTAESHELRLQNEERLFGGLLDYVVGGFLYYTSSPTELVQSSLVAVDPALTGGLSPVPVLTINNTPISRDPANSTEKSVFGNLTLHPMYGLEISAGARYIHYDYESATTINNAVQIPVIPQNFKESATIYAASISYDIADGVMVYGSFGTSYRPPATAIGCFNPTCATPDLLQFQSVEAEKSKSYEIGVKSNWFDNSLRLNVTAFHQTFDNLPYRASGVGTFYAADLDGSGNATAVDAFNFVTGVPAEVTGIEAEIAYKVSRNFNIGATLSYANGKIKNGMIPCNDVDGDGNPDNTFVLPTTGDFTGGNIIATCVVNQRSSFAAPFQASVFGEYVAPLTSKMDYFLRGLLDFDGKSENDPNNSLDDVDAYALLNLYAGLRAPDGQWEVTVFGKNVFNTYRTLSQNLAPGFTPVRSAVLGSGGGISTTTDNYYSNYSPITSTRPREFGVNVRFKFGSS